MIVLEQQTWVTLVGLLVGFASFGLAALAYLASMRQEIKGDIGGLRTEFRGDISDLRTELKTDISDLRTELKTDISDLRTELKTDIAEFRADFRTESAKVDRRLSALEERTYDIASRLPARPAAS
jgi:hypothetical protein